MYGTLENRVKTVENKKKLFTHLNKEAEEIKKHGDIHTYERRAHYNKEEMIEVQDTAEQRRKRKFSEIDLTETQHKFINHRINKFETHEFRAPVTNMASR